jgi:transcriptional regulator with GAF, ATPase, and Fis domain
MASPRRQDVIDRIAEAARLAESFEELGNGIADELGAIVPLDRMNIGLIDMGGYMFTDAFVTGRNVPSRSTGHRRTLSATVVEAGMRTGGGIVIGDEPPETLVERFPRLQSTLDTGIRSMIAAPLESKGETVAALVLASTRPSAYTADDLETVRRVGAAIVERIVALRDDS